ncbi:MAG TPA: HypC/HybG/HupF family hydrogenase formation chaperone [Gallionella sp.]|nr:HypC/HybG/HupF family hydrogenase formation chaperone [Gallionella sp.]
MCIGIPMRVIESGQLTAMCEGRGERQRLNMMMVGEVPAGGWVLSFLGSAREVLTDEEAARINRALDGLDAALRGDFGFDEYFFEAAGRS